MQTIRTSRKFIATFRDSGAYKFIADVRAEGDLERLVVLPKWSPRRLLECLGKLSRNDEDTEDLRIVTTGLAPSWQELHYEEHLDRGICIRIVMMDPKSEALMRAKYGLRRDKYNLEMAKLDFRNQIDYLEGVISRFPSDALQVRLSSAMPSTLIFHSRDWALFGTFPAQGSYALGPMIETAETASPLWGTLYEDWKVRWDDPAARLVIPASEHPA